MLPVIYADQKARPEQAIRDAEGLCRLCLTRK